MRCDMHTAPAALWEPILLQAGLATRSGALQVLLLDVKRLAAEATRSAPASGHRDEFQFPANFVFGCTEPGEERRHCERVLPFDAPRPPSVSARCFAAPRHREVRSTAHDDASQIVRGGAPRTPLPDDIATASASSASARREGDLAPAPFAGVVSPALPALPVLPATVVARPSPLVACQTALSYLMCWGVTHDNDTRNRAEAGLRPPAPHIAYGVCGPSGSFSFLTPSAQACQHRLQCSTHLTALCTIAPVALANALMACPACSDERNACFGLVTHLIALRRQLQLFCAPSLSLLARYFADVVEEVRLASRAVMESTLLRMDFGLREQVVSAWTPTIVRAAHVAPAVDLVSTQGIPVVVLSVIACIYSTPVEPRVGALLVRQLVLVLCHSLR